MVFLFFFVDVVAVILFLVFLALCRHRLVLSLRFQEIVDLNAVNVAVSDSKSQQVHTSMHIYIRSILLLYRVRMDIISLFHRSIRVASSSSFLCSFGQGSFPLKTILNTYTLLLLLPAGLPTSCNRNAYHF